MHRCHHARRSCIMLKCHKRPHTCIASMWMFPCDIDVTRSPCMKSNIMLNLSNHTESLTQRVCVPVPTKQHLNNCVQNISFPAFAFPSDARHTHFSEATSYQGMRFLVFMSRDGVDVEFCCTNAHVHISICGMCALSNTAST